MPLSHIALWALILCLLQLEEVAASSSGSQHPLFKGAHQAIKDKKCLGDYDGDVTMKHRIVSSCFAGGFIEEVTLHPCKEGACDDVKAAAKVIYTCDTSRPRVKCLSA
mmetsp:Transcript_8549/g.14495  ORF Transcript_8549/g.14495 Transcript_8549/m.14495 type:complete len:108 (+) Transcript_8549:128-451(+)